MFLLNALPITTSSGHNNNVFISVDDFQISSENITFNCDVFTNSIDIIILNDDIFEADETFELVLTVLEGDPDGLATLGLDTVNITIVGDGK